MIMTQTWKNMVTHWVRIINVPRRRISASSAAKTATSCGAKIPMAPPITTAIAAPMPVVTQKARLTRW